MVLKRREDQEHEDHSAERHPVDWKLVAPRWFLVTVIVILLPSVGWLFGVSRNLQDDRLARMERYQSDSRWELLLKHGAEISDLRGELRRHGDQLEKLAGLAEDVRVLRRIAESSRKKGYSNGYGPDGGSK